MFFRRVPHGDGRGASGARGAQIRTRRGRENQLSGAAPAARRERPQGDRGTSNILSNLSFTLLKVKRCNSSLHVYINY